MSGISSTRTSICNNVGLLEEFNMLFLRKPIFPIKKNFYIFWEKHINRCFSVPIQFYTLIKYSNNMLYFHNSNVSFFSIKGLCLVLKCHSWQCFTRSSLGQIAHRGTLLLNSLQALQGDH